MKKLLLTISSLILLGGVHAQTAKVQLIHNCADAAGAQVDVYLDGVKVQDDVPFRSATTFLSVPAGQLITFGVAPANSVTVADTFYSLSTQLMNNGTYVAVANGIVSSTGYAPAPKFSLDVYGMGRESASNPANTDLLILHGSTDAPTVDVRSGVNTLANNLSYGDFSTGYIELPTLDYKVRLTNETGSATVQTYSAPLSSALLGGVSGVVVASGFLNPANNSNGPAFGLYVATPSGGPMIMLPVTDAEALARYQVIHNSADAAAAQVDVYVNGVKALDDFAFRTATEFLDAPANTPLQIGIAPQSSTSVMDTFYTTTATLDSAGKYILIANGIESMSGYAPAPELRLSVYSGARETANTTGNVDVLVMHGSTDAPTVDVQAYGNTLVEDIKFGDFSAGYIELPVNNYMLDVTDETGATTVASYNAILQDLMLGDAAITVLASGFLTPASNSNGAAFGLYAATAAGGALVPLPVATSVGSLTDSKGQVVVWPNPAQNTLTVAGDFSNDAVINIMDITGKAVLQTSATSQSIDISTLIKGVYVLSVNDNGNSGFVKFVKQ